MAFPVTYNQILRMIKGRLLDAQVARDIVRKAGLIPGQGSENLAGNGEPWDVITKLSDVDFDVGWRKGGLGPEMSQLFNSGPPCNLRTLSFTRLRDSFLRSGTSNASRFGYGFDAMGLFNDPDYPFPDPTSYFLRSLGWIGSTVADLFDTETFTDLGIVAEPITDDVILVTKDQARFISYVTRAEFPYTFKLTLDRFPQTGLDPITYTANRTGTGRFVSEWYDFPEYDPDLRQPSFGLERPYGHAFTTASIEATEDIPAAEQPNYEELQEGVSPLCMPFFEVEVRTVYYAESSYWVQDDYTPEEYRVTQASLEN